MHNITAIVLAAGKGTRMKSELPKCLHKICGEPMILYPIKSCYDAGIRDFVIVVGYKNDLMQKEIINLSLRKYFKGIKIEFAYQDEQLGSAHAVAVGSQNVKDRDILVINGDSVLISSENILDIQKLSKDFEIVFSVCDIENPTDWGRVVETEEKFEIIEEKFLSDSQKNISLVNIGLYYINKSILKSSLEFCVNESSKRGSEQYLTDIVCSIEKSRVSMNTVQAQACSNVNTRLDLVEIEQKISETINNDLLQNGVTIRRPESVVISPLVFIESDVEIEDNVKIYGDSQIKSGVSILSNTRITTSFIENNAVIGPNAYLREGTIVGKNSKIGSFVETKKLALGNNSKVPHLSYIGDCSIGENTNVGAGSITANYDGVNKHNTKIGSNVKVGAGTTIVAPATLNDNVITGANSVILNDVIEGDTVVGIPAKSKSVNKGEK